MSIEYRIGNWFQCDVWDNGNIEYFQVRTVSKDGVFAEDMEGIFGEFNGIPITPELLEKCGFEQYENTSQICLTFKNLTIEKDGDKWNWTIRYASGNTFGDKTSGYYHHAIPIQYIHQLQNLYYCLTGTELEINL